MNDIYIKEITKDNWEEAFKISVKESQISFVPTVIESIAFAYIRPWDEALDPYVLYKNDKIIGAFYLSYTPNSEDKYWIGGFQIDQRLQGKGYGKQSLYQIINFIKEKHPNCKVLSLTVEKENHQAIRLYEKAGFITENKENSYHERNYTLQIR